MRCRFGPKRCPHLGQETALLETVVPQLGHAPVGFGFRTEDRYRQPTRAIVAKITSCTNTMVMILARGSALRVTPAERLRACQPTFPLDLANASALGLSELRRGVGYLSG